MAYDFCEISNVSHLCELPSLFPHNIAGINEAILFPEQYIISTPTYSFVFDENKSAQLEGAIVLKAGATGYRFRFTSDTGSFSEKMSENSDGVFYDQLFSIDIPKDRPELTWLKYRMSRSRYTVLYRDKNGQAKIARNLRVKFNLDIGKSSSDYNGHTMFARKASTVPALHWNISSSSTLESLFQESRISFDAYYTKFDDGWQTGQKVNLPFEPIDIESIYAVYNNSLILQPGADFLLQGNTITILFDDQPQSLNSSSELSFFYACNKLNAGISSFYQQVIQKTASYLPGETLILDQAPVDQSHVAIRLNSAVSLRAGVDFSLSGNIVTINFGEDPTLQDPDVFHILYMESGNESFGGWKYYSHSSALGLIQPSTIQLPHIPVANSLLVRYQGVLQLLPATDYNVSNNEVEILFDLEPNSMLEFWYAYQ